MCKYVYCIVILVYGEPLLGYCTNLKNMCVYVHVYYTFIIVLVVSMGALIMCAYGYYTVVLVSGNPLCSYHGNLKNMYIVYCTFVVVSVISVEI
jgi:hypothetical protein